MSKIFIYIAIATAILAACATDAYETGDSSLSYMRADMADMKVEGRAVKSIVTDQSLSLPFDSKLSVSEKMARPDTTYRVMLYYNKVEGKDIEIISSQLVSVVNPAMDRKLSTEAIDPLILTSAWQAENGKYINVRLGLKTGNAGDEAKQYIDVRLDSIVVHRDGATHRYLTLCHGQNNIPQYYTQDAYLSISQTGYGVGDVTHLRVNTYEGVVEKNFTKYK